MVIPTHIAEKARHHHSVDVKKCGAFIQRRFYTQQLLHTDTFTQRRFLHTETFTHRRFYTQTLDTFTHRGFYTETLLHTHTLLHADTFTRKHFYIRHFYTQTRLHTDAFTHRRFYTQKRLHTGAFTHRSFYIPFLTSSTWWHRALLQTIADISLVKCHMCDLQHNGTDLFWAIYVGFSIIKWNNMSYTASWYRAFLGHLCEIFHHKMK